MSIRLFFYSRLYILRAYKWLVLFLAFIGLYDLAESCDQHRMQLADRYWAEFEVRNVELDPDPCPVCTDAPVEYCRDCMNTGYAPQPMTVLQALACYWNSRRLLFYSVVGDIAGVVGLDSLWRICAARRVEELDKLCAANSIERPPPSA